MTSSTKPLYEPFTSQRPRPPCTPIVPRTERSERAADRTELRGMSKRKPAIRTRSTVGSTSTPPRPGPPPRRVCLRPQGDPAHIAVVDSEKSRIGGLGGSRSGSGLLVIFDDLAPGDGIRFACFGHTFTGCCPDLVVRHRASAPVAASRRLAIA